MARTWNVNLMISLKILHNKLETFNKPLCNEIAINISKQYKLIRPKTDTDAYASIILGQIIVRWILKPYSRLSGVHAQALLYCVNSSPKHLIEIFNFIDLILYNL